jgi:glycosyltransferase involved in cell wall biosynthesis
MVTVEWPSNEFPARVPFLLRQVELLRKRGVEVDIFHFEGKKNPLNYLLAVIRVGKFLRNNKVDFVHAQWGQSAVPVFFNRHPLVITFRGSDLYGIVNPDGSYTWKSYLLRGISRLVARKAKRIILVGEAMKKLLPASVLDKVEVIPSGIDLNLFRPMQAVECRRRLGLVSDRKIVLFGANPERPEKRYYLAEQAVQLLRKKLDVEMIALINVKPADVPYYINAADVIVLTSAHEGSPNIVKEALACNRPVVSVDVGDVKERISGLEGCYVTDDNPEAIAAGLLMALSVERPRDLRSSVLNLDENRITDQIIQVYRKVPRDSTRSLT